MGVCEGAIDGNKLGGTFRIRDDLGRIMIYGIGSVMEKILKLIMAIPD
jgi:hypothetical protein